MKVRFTLAFAIFAITPIAAMAQSQQEQNACMSDVFNVCGHAVPDRDRVVSCLVTNVNRISSECRTVVQRYSKSIPRPQPTSTRYGLAADR
jgi:hypothetical protein